MPLVHITIDTATHEGLKNLSSVGHRTFAAEARWALSWWVENGGGGVKTAKDQISGASTYQDDMRRSISRFCEAEEKRDDEGRSGRAEGKKLL